MNPEYDIPAEQEFDQQPTTDAKYDNQGEQESDQQLTKAPEPKKDLDPSKPPLTYLDCIQNHMGRLGQQRGFYFQFEKNSLVANLTLELSHYAEAILSEISRHAIAESVTYLAFFENNTGHHGAEALAAKVRTERDEINGMVAVGYGGGIGTPEYKTLIDNLWSRSSALAYGDSKSLAAFQITEKWAKDLGSKYAEAYRAAPGLLTGIQNTALLREFKSMHDKAEAAQKKIGMVIVDPTPRGNEHDYYARTGRVYLRLWDALAHANSEWVTSDDDLHAFSEYKKKLEDKMLPAEPRTIQTKADLDVQIAAQDANSILTPCYEAVESMMKDWVYYKKDPVLKKITTATIDSVVADFEKLCGWLQQVEDSYEENRVFLMEFLPIAHKLKVEAEYVDSQFWWTEPPRSSADQNITDPDLRELELKRRRPIRGLRDAARMFYTRIESLYDAHQHNGNVREKLRATMWLMADRDGMPTLARPVVGRG